MLFSRQIPLSSLIEFCRALRHNLGAGLPIVRVMRQQAERGPLAVRPVAARITEELEKGESLRTALRSEKAHFPPLFLQLADVGEKTGYLPEVLGELEKYYQLQQKLWRQFMSQIAWPVTEFIISVLVIALMLLVLGWLPRMPDGRPPVDPIGLGVGTAGALRWLGLVIGILAILGGSAMLTRRTLERRAKVDSFLLRVPVIGPTLMALALNRFCLALRLTTETGMPIAQALRMSFNATGNAAFEAAAGTVKKPLLAGKDLTSVLAGTRLFPRGFLDILAVAEEGGRISEVMEHQANVYEEELRMRLTRLTHVASWGVWMAVAMVIIWAIFRIFMTTILPAYSIS